MDLTTAVASLQATASSGFAEMNRRFEEQNSVLERVEEQVRITNGRVTALETVNKVKDAQSGQPTVGVVTLSQLKFYAALAIGSGSMAVAVTLWVLKMAGKI